MNRALAVVLAVATVLTHVGTGHAQPSTRTWLALGDSYASGEGIVDTRATPSAVLGRDCRRATGTDSPASAWAAGAYARVKDRLGLGEIAFVACTGAITDEAPSQASEARGSTGRDRWDVVSFSFGGNNILFADIIKGCIIPVKRWELYVKGCHETEEQLRRRVDMLVQREKIDSVEFDGSMTLPNLLDQVSEYVAPGGDVIITGYPNLVEDPRRWGKWRKRFRNCSGIQRHDVPMLRNVGAYLNEQIGRAVAAANQKYREAGIRFHFLDISRDPYELDDDPANRHARCTDDPWLNGFVFDKNNDGRRFYTNRSYHPNQRGHTHTARVVADYVLANVTFDNTTTPPTPRPSVPVDPKFLGTWRSPLPVSQPGFDKAYYAELTIGTGPVGAKIGDVFYPNLNCGGRLTLVESSSDRLVLTENIESDPEQTCAKQGTVTLVPSAGSGLRYQYTYVEPGPYHSASALLERK